MFQIHESSMWGQFSTHVFWIISSHVTSTSRVEVPHTWQGCIQNNSQSSNVLHFASLWFLDLLVVGRSQYGQIFDHFILIEAYIQSIENDKFEFSWVWECKLTSDLNVINVWGTLMQEARATYFDVLGTMNCKSFTWHSLPSHRSATSTEIIVHLHAHTY